MLSFISLKAVPKIVVGIWRDYFSITTYHISYHCPRERERENSANQGEIVGMTKRLSSTINSTVDTTFL